MRGIRILAIAAAVVGLGIAACDDDDPVAPPVEQYVAQLNGNNEVEPPAKVIGATGTATIRVEGNTVTYTVTTANFASGTTATSGSGPLGAHIHEGAAGVNGGIIVNLSATVNGTMTGTATAADMSAALTKIRTGDTYVNVHTNNRPAGEIRGQLVRQQ